MVKGTRMNQASGNYRCEIRFHSACFECKLLHKEVTKVWGLILCNPLLSSCCPCLVVWLIGMFFFPSVVQISFELLISTHTKGCLLKAENVCFDFIDFQFKTLACFWISCSLHALAGCKNSYRRNSVGYNLEGKLPLLHLFYLIQIFTYQSHF